MANFTYFKQIHSFVNITERECVHVGGVCQHWRETRQCHATALTCPNASCCNVINMRIEFIDGKSNNQQKTRNGIYYQEMMIRIYVNSTYTAVILQLRKRVK